MEVERKVFNNAFLLGSGQIVAQLANFGFVILLARSFGASTLGIYSLAMAVGALSGIFVGFGTNSIARRAIARDPSVDRDVLGTIFPLQLIAGCAVFFFLTAATLFITEDVVIASVIVIVGMFHIIIRWQVLFSTRFHARQSMAFIAKIQAGTRLSILLIGGAALALTQDIIVVAISLPISVIGLTLLVFLYGNYRFGTPHFSFGLDSARSTLRSAWPFFSILLLAVLYERLGIVILRIFQPDSAVGVFASAERLLVPFSAMFSVFVSAVFPALMRVSPDALSERDLLGKRFLRVLLSLALPAATLVYLFSADIILALYGTEFEEAISVLSIMAWAIALRGFNSFLSMLKISADLQILLSVQKLIALVFFVTSCAFLIPTYSYLGLAYAIVLSDTFLACMMFWSLRREKHLEGFLGILWRPILSCAGTIAIMINLTGLPFGVRFALSVVALAVTALMTGAIKRHDFGFLRRIASVQRSVDAS